MFILVLCTFLSCENETVTPASATPPVFDQDSSFKQLPRITITQIDQWLGFSLEQIHQFRLIQAKNYSHSSEKYNRKLSSCSEHWSSFQGVNLSDWPRKDAKSMIDFYMLDGKVEVIVLKIYELYSSKPSSKWDTLMRYLGFHDKSKDYIRFLESRKLNNALQPLDSFMKDKCKISTYQKQSIGYQCKTFGLSQINDGPASNLSSALHMLELGELDTYMDILSFFERPSSPMYVQHELCDGCYGVRLFIYKNKDSFLNYIKFLSYSLNTYCY